MKIHKNTKLLPYHKKQIYNKYHIDSISVATLAIEYQVSKPTIYKALEQVKNKTYKIQINSTNKRFKSIKYGIKRLAKVELKIEESLKRQAKRYNKSYPGEMVHVDSKRLPLLKGEKANTHLAEYLFVGIDDHSRELYATIQTDKSARSSRDFLDQMIDECPYTIECIYSDNGLEFKGNLESHEFVRECYKNGIVQRFTRPRTPQTNGKAERVIRTLMEMWHTQYEFKSREERYRSLIRFINHYNTVKPHASLEGNTPYEWLKTYFQL